MDIMDASASQTSSLTASIERLFLSSVRLSGAATLFGVAQFETAMNGWQQGGGFGQQLDRFGSTVNSLTRCLVDEMSPGKKEALESISEITSKLVHQSMDGMNLLDPRQVIQTATSLAQKSSEMLTGWTS